MARTEARTTELRGRDYLVALVLFALSFAALGYAQRDQGVMRDEGTYFRAAESYWGWFAEMGDNLAAGRIKDSFTNQSISRYFKANREHPVLFKLLFSASWRLLGEPQAKQVKPRYGPSLGWLSEISAFRLPTWLFTALAVALLYLFGARIESRTAGLAAALLYISMPRTFFHGQLACFDSGVTTMWLLTIYAYYRSLASGRWGLLLGLFFGLALATKHNAWFLPPILLIHYLIVVWPDLSLRPLRLPRIPLGFVAMAILGPLVFWAHWPWIWYQTYERLEWYFRFHLHHSFYNMEYLGVNWGPPPLPVSYPFGMTLFTAPTVLLVLALVGCWIYARVPITARTNRWLKRRLPRFDDRFRFPARRSWLRPGNGLDPRIGTLLVVNALFPLVLIALPSTPIFGGTKHFMPAYPFFALLAGVAVSRLAGKLTRYFRRVSLAPLLLPLLVALPGALNTYFTHPFGLSQYNALAGGPAGGADKGLNRQFWGYATRQVLPWVDETFEQGARVYFHDTSWDAHRAYVRDGLLRPDVRYAGMELPAIRASTHAMVIHELHFNKYDYWIWDTYGTAAPARVLALDNVPLVSVYDRQDSAAGLRVGEKR